MQAPIEETLLDFGVTGGRLAPPEVLPHHGQAEVVEFERLPQASQTPGSMTGSMPQFSRGTERGDLGQLTKVAAARALDTPSNWPIPKSRRCGCLTAMYVAGLCAISDRDNRWVEPARRRARSMTVALAEIDRRKFTDSVCGRTELSSATRKKTDPTIENRRLRRLDRWEPIGPAPRGQLLDTPTTFWGKLDRSKDGGCTTWHPLVDHCADVASVVEALLRLPVWRNRLARLAERDLDDMSLARLCVLAALHDIGKFNIGFQAKGRAELGPIAGHVTEAIGALFHPEFSSFLSELSAWGDGVTGLMVTAICHHGRPYNAEMVADTAWQASWWTPRAGLDPRAGASDLFTRCRRWFPAAFEQGGAPLPEAAGFSHAFAGVLMLADWIGSDTRFFRFSEKDEGDRMDFARPRACEAVDEMALDVAPAARSDRSQRDPFTRVALPDYRPRPAQSAVLTLPHDSGGSITILEAETGSGKTEAALARFVSLFDAGLVDGLYFALPTRSAATQMHQRVHKAALSAFAPPPSVILAVPGYLRVDDADGRREKLPSFEVLWPDQERFRYRAWAAEGAKRYLVGCIVVGTVDQVLLSSLMVGHAHLRAAALLRHLLVVDEVHASDAYMTRILEDVLARHRAAGGHALLLSATLGGEVRTRLLYPGERTTPPTIADAEAAPYPLISHRGPSARSIPVSDDGPGRVISVAARPYLETPERLAADAYAAAALGAKVLVIKNTVNDCVATQLAIERLAEASGRTDVLFSCSGAAAPHHARFARVDREALDVELEKSLGKERAGGGCVVVATQTVQQSLDLDADVLFSDLCPADVLLQRIGRLHRHNRARPAGFERPRAFVMTPAHRDLGLLIRERGTPRHHHGLGSVYPDMRMLEATWRLVESDHEWRIPAMNRYLVEKGLHSDILGAISEEGGTRWQAHAGQMIGATLGQRRQADLNLVDWSKPYAETSFPSAVDERIMTRLGEGDRRVRFQTPVTGPFKRLVNELTLRASWASGTPADVEFAERVTSEGGVTRFVFGKGAFVYNRLGLRPDKAALNEGSHDDGP